MSCFCKIFLKFEKRFWDDVKALYINNGVKGYYTFWRPFSETVLAAIVTGDEARRIER
jgi:hypothetical protein